MSSSSMEPSDLTTTVPDSEATSPATCNIVIQISFKEHLKIITSIKKKLVSLEVINWFG